VHLKSLTLKGFKSFASSTTFRFEPGITAVVGPNGSGKSNVVDAIAWVLGEQGAKSLRGGKMEDVIFAGTSGRPPLGRAEVTLTIDNSDGALPIEYTEVTISRIMFRSGGSEYAINGQHCRLLDVQELLSDSGIGRELHVIVGQGQLDSVLSAGPEERRGFIEEAAGVLKHRKRKEKALRKLEAMQANLTRVQDLNAELRRQLKPLGRQAEIARRAVVIQADQRDARLRLLADDLVQMTSTLEAEVADETALRERRGEVERALADVQGRETQLEQTTTAEGPTLARTQETWYRLSSLRERFSGTRGLAAERVRHLAEEPDEQQAMRDPDELEREAGRVRNEEREIAAAVERDRELLAASVTARQAAEHALLAEEQRIAAAARAAADRREGLARLAGQVAARRSKVEGAEAEMGRLAPAFEEAAARADRAQAEFAALETQVAGLDAGEQNLDSEHGHASAALAAAEQKVTTLRAEERDAERERAALGARKEALELGLTRRDGAGTLLAASDRLTVVLGSVAALITVEHGYETAIAAALGRAADAVAVRDVSAAVDAIRLLKADDAGRAGLLVASVGDAGPDSTHPGATDLPDGARPALDLLVVPDDLAPVLGRLLSAVAVVDGLAEARALVEHHPHLLAVTRAGDVLGGDRAEGGSATEPSLLEVQAAVDEADSRLREAGHRLDRLRFALQGATEQHAAAQRTVQAALDRLHQSDARLAAVAEQLGQLGAQARSARGESERLQRSIAAAREQHDADSASLAELEERLAAAEQAPGTAGPAEPETAVRDELAERCRVDRQAEMEARLAVRTGEERTHALAARAEALDRAAAEERSARARAVARRERRAREALVARAVAAAADTMLGHLERSLALAAEDRAAAESARAERDAERSTLRTRARELSVDLDRLTDSVHRDEVARAEQRLRIEALQQKALEDLGVEPQTLIDEYGPDQLVAPSPPAPGDEPVTTDDGMAALEAHPTAYVREEQEKRLRTAERALALLGRVNPLALEEFEALEERHQFLSEQLEDLKASRRDLLDIVREVDERVELVFTAAFEDTAREFEGVFARLFPGGEGRLVLTDPGDMLTTGIEVEARPPGKKVKRLSLLSGGERSLTAVALLVAIFRARPSPFYVMDEVEAALDDTNLGRLIQILEELRESSQLIVITHQKRTMEIADALYGVSMRGDGVTSVIGQRLREAEPA
jgi:chromosome segregation protein